MVANVMVSETRQCLEETPEHPQAATRPSIWVIMLYRGLSHKAPESNAYVNSGTC